MRFQDMDDRISNLDLIVIDYPAIFEQSFYFEIGEGWAALIREMCEEIMKLPREEISKATQVKSKFGDLRFYTGEYSPSMQSIIDKFEEKCRHLCEFCGARINEDEVRHAFDTRCAVCYVTNI